MRFKKLLQELDYWIPMMMIVLIGIGLVIIKSATQSGELAANQFVIKQLAATILGFLLLLFVLLIDYRILKNSSGIIYLLTVLLLLIVLFLGQEISGSKSWLSLGPFNFQPSEVAKLGLIISLADFLSRRRQKLTDFKHFLFACLFILPIFALVLAQKDLGTSLVLLAIFAGMFFVAGANIKYYLSLAVGAVVILGGALVAHFQFGIAIPLKKYQLMRLIIFWNPKLDPLGYGYNIIQSKITIGSGGLLGKGLFAGTQTQLGFLPEQHTDFIFSVLGEELGFVGAFLVLICFFILIWRSIKVAAEAKDDFGQLLVVGIISMFLFHIFENVGMAMGIMPITGLPLPFISYGGSSLLTNILAVGLIINVNIRKKKLIF
ncbi:MAG: rod shape-determining protein RodA [Bacillota bacterium]